MSRFFYTTVLPALLGLAVMAAVVLPGDDLTLTRLLFGCGAMIAVQVVTAYLGGRMAARPDEEPTT